MKSEKKKQLLEYQKQIQVKTSFSTNIITGHAITHLLIGATL
jgi:hypothetical protein